MAGVRGENSSDGKPRWICLCDCGNTKLLRAACLRDGTTSSCGCLASELTKLRTATHRETGSSTWLSWRALRRRCRKVDDSHYPDYGGRGITVCERWSRYENFLEDMGHRTPGMTIDRVDNNGNYCKENCKWSTATEQSRNKRTNVMLSDGTRTMLAADWARELNTSQTTLYDRIRRGWSEFDTVTKPIKRHKKTRLKH